MADSFLFEDYMSLFAIGDLHLHINYDINEHMNMFDRMWHNRLQLIRQNFERLVTDNDTVVFAGDSSFARKVEGSVDDFAFIESLPGRKIILRGNHDMYWDAKKTEKLQAYYGDRLFFLQNNYYPYGDYAIVGTKGYTFENKDSYEHSEMLVEREVERLRISFEKARNEGYEKYIMFLHYPPTNIFQNSSSFTDIAEEYGAEKVIYAHCHGKKRFNDSILGVKNNIRYSLVSGDYLNWVPKKII